MKQLLEQIVIRLPFYFRFKNAIAKRRQQEELSAWEKQGRPVPPPHLVKQELLRTVARQYGLKILVETGTYKGDMVEAMKHLFEHIYSIELSESLYRKVRQRFKGQKKITLVQGDSGIELEQVVHHIDEPALFWLDGHYSAGVTAKGESDTPIMKELSHILSRPDEHVILIDDAHLFGRDPAYPSLDEVRNYIKSKRPQAGIAVRDNIIVITPEARTVS